jgi:hypothetical protein
MHFGLGGLIWVLENQEGEKRVLGCEDVNRIQLALVSLLAVLNLFMLSDMVIQLFS